MKKGIIKLIHIYQKIPCFCHSSCHFYPTCSNYMIEAINEYGTIKGVYLGIKRILRCHPGASFGYDPVPVIKKKEGVTNEEK